MAQRSISTTFSLREGVTGRLADDSEQATGLRKDELEEEMKGNERFNRSMLWVDRIGKYYRRLFSAHKHQQQPSVTIIANTIQPLSLRPHRHIRRPNAHSKRHE